MRVEIMLNGVEKEYTLKDSWEDITTENFVKVANVTQNKDLSDTHKLVLLITELSGIDIDAVMSMDIEYLQQFEKSLGFLNEAMPEYNEDHIVIGDEKYFFKADYSKLTFGEVISIEKITEKVKTDMYEVFPSLLCIFLRKKVDGKLEAFDGEFMDRADLFKQVPIHKVNKLLMGFLNGEKES